MKKIILLLLLSISLSSKQSHLYSIQNLFSRYKIDIDTKSDKGWIRLFNSYERLDKYGYFYSEKEKKDIKIFFKTRLDNKKERVLK